MLSRTEEGHAPHAQTLPRGKKIESFANEKTRRRERKGGDELVYLFEASRCHGRRTMMPYRAQRRYGSRNSSSSLSSSKNAYALEKARGRVQVINWFFTLSHLLECAYKECAYKECASEEIKTTYKFQSALTFDSRVTLICGLHHCFLFLRSFLLHAESLNL